MQACFHFDPIFFANETETKRKIAQLNQFGLRDFFPNQSGISISYVGVLLKFEGDRSPCLRQNALHRPDKGIKKTLKCVCVKRLA